jgi:hypothetical protein
MNVKEQLIFDAIKEKKWWRLFNLRGKTLRLSKPISVDYYPSFKGDRYMIKIVNYIPDLGNQFYNVNHPGEPIDSYLFSDWVVFENHLTPLDLNHSINLSLLDFNYFKSVTN